MTSTVLQIRKTDVRRKFLTSNINYTCHLPRYNRSPQVLTPVWRFPAYDLYRTANPFMNIVQEIILKLWHSMTREFMDSHAYKLRRFYGFSSMSPFTFADSFFTLHTASTSSVRNRWVNVDSSSGVDVP